MKPRVTGLVILTCFVAAAQMKDFEGYKDPALFTRMPHYFLSTKDSLVETPFDAYEFPVKNGTQRVEGRHLHYTYDFDESNINRLTKLLKEMADQTQFVVITHSKRTMEAAQALYGVTMQEPGVSRLVSVKLNAAEAAA